MNSNRKKKEFSWYPSGREKGIQSIVEALIGNPHYNLNETSRICLEYSCCTHYHLMSVGDKEELNKDILVTLKEQVSDSKRTIQTEIVQTLEGLKSSIEYELERATNQTDYMPSLDRDDARKITEINNLEYEANKLDHMLERIQNEMNITEQ